MGKIEDEIKLIDERRSVVLTKWRKAVAEYRALGKKKRELKKALTIERNNEFYDMARNYDIQIGDIFKISKNSKNMSRNYPVGAEFIIKSIAEKSFGIQWFGLDQRIGHNESTKDLNQYLTRIPKDRLFRIVINNTDDDVTVRRELRLKKLLY